jgi:hypothetical protein
MNSNPPRIETINSFEDANSSRTIHSLKDDQGIHSFLGSSQAEFDSPDERIAWTTSECDLISRSAIERESDDSFPQIFLANPPWQVGFWTLWPYQ